ncbi:MAG: DUF512 domain-containing protein [Gemmatimonadota bacterium]
MIRVAHVRPGSIAAELGIEPRSHLLRINGSELRDSVDLLYRQAAEAVELEVESPDGARVIYEIHKPAEETLGLRPEPDKIRRCTNACPFCFVKGNPSTRKLRAGLYVKDDDYRLSFLYGHYITLTNLREEDWDRILEQRLSPLYVSVHATDPAARLRMLVNPRSAAIREDLGRLLDGGIRVHAQVVLCPGFNDGKILQETIEDLYGLGPDLLSLSIVPVGLTTHNADRGVRPLMAAECRAALAQIEAARVRALRERGRGWCYAADEMFLEAGLPPPDASYFDDRELVSNGVGAISSFRQRVREGLQELPALTGLRVVLVTGTSMGPFVEKLGAEVAAVCGADVVTEVRTNSLYGPTVTTAGLLSGRDHLEAIRAHFDRDVALFSADALKDGEVFLDEFTLTELRDAVAPVRVYPSHNICDGLIHA